MYAGGNFFGGKLKYDDSRKEQKAGFFTSSTWINSPFIFALSIVYLLVGLHFFYLSLFTMVKQFLHLFVFGVLCACVGCSKTSEQTAQTQQDSLQRTQPTAMGQSPSSVSEVIAPPSSTTTFKIYDATVVIAPAKPLPTKLCGKFAVDELVRTLYTPTLKPDETTTLTIGDIVVEALDTAAHTYMAIVKTATNADDCVIDVFTFREGNAQPVIAHVAYNPDFDDIELGTAHSHTYRITDTEFAVGFEWSAKQTDAQHTQQTTMLSLFRVQGDVMLPIFEVCTYNKASNNAVSAGEYESQSEDKATLETMNTWGKDLYSILVTRTITRKSNIEISGRANESKRTKTLYQWDGERYIETNQLL